LHNHALLTGLNLSGAVLDHADFTDAEFIVVVLTDASIRDALCPSGEVMLWNDDLDGVCPSQVQCRLARQAVYSWM